MTLTFNVFGQTSKSTTVYNPQNTSVDNSKSFAGFYTQLGLGYQSFTPNFSNSTYSLQGTSYGSNTPTSSSQSMAGTITAGYNFSFGPSFLLGIGGELSPVPGKATVFGGTTIGSTTIPSSNFTVNNTLNLFVSPIFPVDNLTAIYGKVGYSKANVTSGPNLDALSYTGYSVGLGYRTIISGNFYAYVEGNYYNYGKVSDSGTAIIPGSSTQYGYSNSSTANAYNLLYGFGMQF
jgi:hypothetical protein